jgi:hypothetical protein
MGEREWIHDDLSIMLTVSYLFFLSIILTRPGKNWDLRILDPEEHFSKSSNRGTF